jgi:class 3 adenylate cyclase/tetratricopeptide (TPR) repeat protein
MDEAVLGGTHRGERRHLTVVFCDLVESTALSELLDPEETSELVLAYQEMGHAAVTELGGYVAQYLGDGLLIYFGYPTAHEDDAERAVRAGLAIVAGLRGMSAQMRPTAGVHLAARVGIHTGPTIVGAMGNADRSDISVFGSTPNIAARLESHAQPGTVLISNATRRLLHTRFRLADRGSPALKGVRQDIHVWEVAGVDVVTPRAQVQPAVPLVGRQEELALICACLDDADAGMGRTVLMTGEPGVGKSRLLQAVYQRVVGTDHVWLEFQCSQLASGSPLQPVIDLLERSIGPVERDAVEDRRARLSVILEPLGRRAPAMVPYVAELLGIGDPDELAHEGPELRRRRGLDALAEWPIALAADRPVVVVAEDLHWCDPTSLELVRQVADQSRDHRVLCLFTQRPDNPVELGAPTTEVSLSRLSLSDGQELVRRLAPNSALPPEDVVALADRGDGIPLFIEELVRAAEEGRPTADGTAVPETLQVLLTARLDRLGIARRVAQAASVLGRTFPLALLEAMPVVRPDDLKWALSRLDEAGLMVIRRDGDQVDCEFRHALIQDAAYASLLRRQRQELHAHVVKVLEERFDGQLTASPELLAHHLARSEQHVRAAEWYARAGRRAAAHAAFDEAVTHYRSGLATLDHVLPGRERDERMLSLDILLANALMGSTGLGGADLLPIWEEAISLAEKLGDDEELTSALNGAAVYHLDHGEDDIAIHLAERIVDIGIRTGSRIAALRGNGTLGMARLFRAEGKQALEHSELAISLSRDGDFEVVTYGVGHDERVFFHTVASWNLWWLGRPDAGLAMALEGSRRAAALPSSLSQAMARHAVALIRHLRGESDEATAVAAENLRFTDEVGLPFWRGLALLVLGIESARSGDVRGRTQVDLGLDLLAKEGNSGGASFTLAMLTDTQLHLGAFDDAVATADLGLATSAALRQPFYDPELLRLKAIAIQRGRSDSEPEVIALLQNSLRLATKLGAASWALRTATTLAPLLGRGSLSALTVDAVIEDTLACMGDGHDTVDQQEARRVMVELTTDGARRR